jgi:hypothetical protein
MKKLLLLAMAFLSAVPTFLYAQQATHAVTELPNYACMALNLPSDEMMNPNIQVPILSSPRSASTLIGRASSIVIVSDPLITSNGYVRVLHLNGKTGWIPERFIKAWVSPGDTGDRCFPALLSNGRIGFDFHK